MNRSTIIKTLVVALVVGVAFGTGLILNAAVSSGVEAVSRMSAPPSTTPPAQESGPSASDIVRSARRLAARSARRPGAALVAQARGRQVALHHRRGGPAYTRLGPLPFSYGTPPAFLVLKRKGDWLQVSLPTRPNGGKAWIKAAAVTLFVTDYEIRVQLRRHRLVLRRGQKTVFDAPIAIGRAVTPTPTGRYFVTYTLRTPDPEGFFGPYALGLSAYSNVVTSFAGGNGQVGIHGTNTPSVLGRDVSHGCIRVGNAVITRLAKTVPLGTPVVIRRT